MCDSQLLVSQDFSSLIQFLTGLETTIEQLTGDIDVQGFSTDFQQFVGVHDSKRFLKRLPINYNCDRSANSSDIHTNCYRSCIYCGDWAMTIPDFRILPPADQTILLKTNYSNLCWFTLSYKCYDLGFDKIGIPLFNATYVPYSRDEYLDEKLTQVYGRLCRRLIEQIVSEMLELDLSFEEYCIFKMFLIFQPNESLSDEGNKICSKTLDYLTQSLASQIENEFPGFNQQQKIARALRISLLLPVLTSISNIELSLMNELGELGIFGK